LLGAADALYDTSRRLAEAGHADPGERRQPDPKQLLAHALAAADAGRNTEALETTAELLSRDPLDAEAYFVRGLVQLSDGRSSDAVASLRLTLAIDPRFSLAAFTLGRAYDYLAEPRQARRAYEDALRSIDPDDDRHDELLRQVDLGDIAAACRARIAALR
jgi:chemotaxis protein methyltransferase CheR